jgi:ABC-2 type transport system permease protein
VRGALRAEWTKLWTISGPGWLLAAIAALTAGLGAVVAAATSYSPYDGFQDTTKLALTGVELGQAVVAILAAGVVTSEYSTRSMLVTLVAMPRRTTVLFAKASIVGLLTLVVAAVGVGAAVVADRFIFVSRGYTAARGYAALSLLSGPTLRAAAGSVLYLGLVALISVGVALAVRDSAVAIGLVLAIFYLFPIVASFVANPTWHRHLEQIGPMTAGLLVQNTVGWRDQVLTPWSGLGVAGLWALGCLLIGGAVLLLRDA